jgi:hypothetical protein
MEKQGCVVFVALLAIMVDGVQGKVRIIERDWDEDFEIRNDWKTGESVSVFVYPRGDLLHETWMYDACSLSLQGGEIRSISAYNNSALYVEEGCVKGWIHLYDNTYCRVTGGSFGKYFRLYGSSKIELFGGETLYSDDESVRVYDNARIIVHGERFKIGGWAVEPGEYTPQRILMYPSPNLACVLKDGHEFELYLSFSDYSRLVLAYEPACLQRPSMDFNGDCKVNIADFAVFASEWMICNLEPQEECWK